MTHYLDYPGLTYYHGRLNSYIGEELATLLPKSEEGEILYVYAGQVDNYSDLPTDANPGDVYNVINADPDNNVKAGDNIAWTGTEWDDLSGYIDTSLYEKYADALADKEELLAEVSDIDTDLTDNYVTSESFESIMSEYVKTAEVEFDKLTDEEIIRAFSPWYWVKLPEDSEGNLVTDINAYYIGNDYYWHKFVYSNNGYIGVPKRLVNPNGFATDCHTMITCEALNDEEQYCPTVAAFVDGNGIYNNDPVIFGTDFDVSKTPIMIAAPSQYAGNMPDVDTSALQETVSNCGDKYGFIYDIKDYDVDTVIELAATEGNDGYCTNIPDIIEAPTFFAEWFADMVGKKYQIYLDEVDLDMFAINMEQIGGETYRGWEYCFFVGIEEEPNPFSELQLQHWEDVNTGRDGANSSNLIIYFENEELEQRIGTNRIACKAAVRAVWQYLYELYNANPYYDFPIITITKIEWTTETQYTNAYE